MEGQNKPKPYLYLEASKRLNIVPERCLVFEDTEAGIEAASQAGMVTIAVPNRITMEQDFSKANKVIPSVLFKDISYSFSLEGRNALSNFSLNFF